MNSNEIPHHYTSVQRPEMVYSWYQYNRPRPLPSPMMPPLSSSQIDPATLILLSMKHSPISRPLSKPSPSPAPKRRRLSIPQAVKSLPSNVVDHEEQSVPTLNTEEECDDMSSFTSASVSSSSIASPPRKRKVSSLSSSPSSSPASSPKRKQNYDSKWLVMYEELKDYRKQNNSCIVPRGYAKNPKLASWVSEQRKQHKLKLTDKPSCLTDFRIGKLNEIGFVWNAQDHAWDIQMKNLRSYKEEFGDCLVPCKYTPNPPLGLWVKEQRRHYWLLKQGKKSQMTNHRVSILNQMGFCWDAQESNWKEKIKALLDFKEKNGHCVVPRHFSKDTALGTWVHHQRTQYKLFVDNKPSTLCADRLAELEEIGFCWSPRKKKGAKN